jgi:hypothetical protein
MTYHRFVVTAVLGLAMLAAGCSDDRPATSAPGPATASAHPSPSPTGTPPNYRMPANLCSAVNADAFADLATVTKTAEMGRASTTMHSSATCILTLGSAADPLLVSVSVDLFTQASGAQAEYEGFRGVAFKDYPSARDVSGAGSAAYFFTDEETGPHLVVRYGNAHLSVSAVAVDPGRLLPANIQDRLVRTANTTLAHLPTS